MAMVAEKLRKAIETRIFNGLKKEFAKEAKDNSKAEEAWKRQAKVMADIALDIVQFLQTDVQVAPGIPVSTAGSPAAQTGASTAPGKLL